jgi:glycosyltransferase involved in cell wall biosynthesis
MQIALVTHNVLSGDGQGRVNLALVRNLLRAGHEVTLLADAIDDHLQREGVHWIPIHPPLKKMSDLLKVWIFRRRADHLLTQMAGHFDAIVACGAVLTVPHTLNAVHFVHGTWLQSPYHTAKVRSGPYAWYQHAYTTLNASWEQDAFRAAQTIVAVSDMVRDELLTIGVPDNRIHVIVNGVDTQTFAPGPADRAALDLPTGVPLALFVGDLQSPIKNLDAVLTAMTQVPALHVAAAGALEHSPYPAMAERLGVADRTHFLNYRDDIADLMRAVDFFVLPSRRDSCPLVHLEAMASGLPTITSTTVGTATLVGDSGFVLDGPDDQATLVHALEALTYDAALRVQMGTSARKRALTLRWDSMADRYRALLEQSFARAPVS